VPKPRPWTVASHRPLERLSEGLWQIDADLEMIPIGRRMNIVRLASGELVLHNLVACDAPTMAAIEALGPVRWLVAPSGHHRMDAPAYAARYPDAKVVTPEASRKLVAERCRVDGALELLPADPTLRWEPLAGVPAEAVFIHTDPTGAVTLIFNDAFMNLPAALPGFKGLIVKLIGSTGGPKVTPTAKYFIVKDRAAYAAHLRRLAAAPNLARIIMAHGAIITTGAAAALAGAADRLHR
jgi:hypothetical protein